MKITDIASLSVSSEATIADVINRIQQSGSVACALLFEKGKFLNIITDGDVRRAFLKGCKLDGRALEIHQIKKDSERPLAITASVNVSRDLLQRLFRKHSLRQIVLTDQEGAPVAVIDHQEFDHLSQETTRKFTALVMAGGFGTRLRPFTLDTPKPMLRINNRPMLEISIEKLISYGADRIFISTHYLPEKITEYFGDGKKFGVEINYVNEATPLGTGGALSLLPFQDENTLVYNGDILTNLDMGMFLAFHLRSQSAMTIAATQYSFEVPFGVIIETDSQVISINEKPNFSFLVNSGIYFISKRVFEMLPASDKFNMTDVAANLIQAGMQVSCFPIFEHWLDVGRPNDFELANDMFL